MLKQFLFVLLHIVLIGSVTGQPTRVRIKNFNVVSDQKQVVIHYDLAGGEPGVLHRVDLAVIDNRGGIVVPDSVTGDLGPGIHAGENKQIVWDIYREFDVVRGNFEPQLVLDRDQKNGFKGGPEKLLFSMLVPGLGDYFVADHHQMTIKPYYKTAFTVGMLGLAWAARAGRETIPAVMAPPGWYWWDTGTEYDAWVYKEDWWVQVPEQTDYWLFRYDAELFLGIGLAAWITDVIWVARRGARNNRVRSSLSEHLSLIPVSGGAAIHFSYQF